MPFRFDLEPVQLVDWFRVSDNLDGIMTSAGQGEYLPIQLVLEDNHALEVVPVVITPPGIANPIHVMIDVVVVEPVPVVLPDGEVDDRFEIGNEIAEAKWDYIVPRPTPALSEGRGHFPCLIPSGFASQGDHADFLQRDSHEVQFSIQVILILVVLK